MDDIDKKIDELIKGTFRRYERLEQLIFNEVYNELSTKLQVREARIVFTPNNLNVITALNRLMDRFSPAIGRIIKYITDGVRQVLGLTAKEMAKIDIRAIKSGKDVVEEATRHSATTANKVLSLEPIFNDVKQSVIASLSTNDGLTLKDLRETLFNKVVNDKLARRYFSRWTHDAFMQYQRIGANRIRIDLGLKFARYTGGLIDTTREWCNKYNRKVLHESEIEAWKLEDWEGKPETGYVPIIDCGGYNCRHRFDWISEELARRLRPEYFTQNPANV